MIFALFVWMGLLPAFSKEGPLYLKRFYSEADVVANVARVGISESDPKFVEFEFRVLKKIKGTADEEKIKVYLKKGRPIDGPYMGDVGMIFLKQEDGRLMITRFIEADDFIVSTDRYLCSSPDGYCRLTKLSEVESHFKSVDK